MGLQLSALSRGKKTPTPKNPFDILNLPSVTLTHIYEYKHYIYCRCICIYDKKTIKSSIEYSTEIPSVRMHSTRNNLLEDANNMMHLA